MLIYELGSADKDDGRATLTTRRYRTVRTMCPSIKRESYPVTVDVETHGGSPRRSHTRAAVSEAIEPQNMGGTEQLA